MPVLDIIIFGIYLLLVLGVGFYFYSKNQNTNDYYVGGRDMSSFHIGLSVVATDVGGGFSIGLGGLGFVMGLSGSWMLFTGLIGAWLAAVLLIPRVIDTARDKNFLTFPQLLEKNYGGNVALVAGVISFIGYLGFTSSQLLAGAKLARGVFPELSILQALLIMGVVAVIYTVFGGIKAVVYTDTFQWSVLMIGLIFIGIPVAYFELGGYDTIVQNIPANFLSLTNVSWVQLVNWAVTIIPIWFVGMTLYQRIYACRDKKTAKRAWYIAGFFEWPVMAFMGIILGLMARVAADQGLFAAAGFTSASGMDAEIGLPMLLKTVLPIGLTGLVLSSYFSAIMSTADSCLLAASGNFVTDILRLDSKDPKAIRVSQFITLGIGAASILIATSMTQVLDLMLLSYSFMVSGLLVPVLGMLFSNKKKPLAAMLAMLLGGTTTISLELLSKYTGFAVPFEFKPVLPGLIISLCLYLSINK